MEELQRITDRLSSIVDPLRLLETFFAHSPVALQILRADGSSIVVNRAFRTLFGLEHATDYSILHDEAAARHGLVEIFRNALDNKVGNVPAFWMQPSPSRRVAVSVTCFPLRGRNDEVEHVVQIYLDETTQLLAREAIEAERDRFRALFDSALDAILILDDRGHITEANASAHAILGYEAPQLVGRDFSHLAEEQVAGNHWWNSLQERGQLRGHAKLRRRDNSICEVEFASIASFLPGRHLSIFHDISDRRKLEDQLRQAQKMEGIGRLAGGVAHDFNNLLTVINGSAEIVAESGALDEDSLGLVREISKAGQRAAELTKQLLAFSRQTIISVTALNLSTIVQDMSKMLKRLIGEDIELTTQTDPGLRAVVADRTQIEQVILNLAVNARDAMPKGGKLIIETRSVELDEPYAAAHTFVQPGHYVLLTVSDNGCGMTAETQSHLFEPFFTTKEPGKGTGLGLATVYGIVKQAGGNIMVYSELGRGTTFKVYLPATEIDAKAAQQSQTRTKMPRGSETVLLVEDEEAVRNIARLVLESCGYTVLQSHNGANGMEMASRHSGKIHLLLTDLVMPQMSGHELAEALQAARPETKVLYMSGYTDDAIVRYGVLHSEMAFLQKPFTPAGLAKKIREVLDASTPG